MPTTTTTRILKAEGIIMRAPLCYDLDIEYSGRKPNVRDPAIVGIIQQQVAASASADFNIEPPMPPDRLMLQKTFPGGVCNSRSDVSALFLLSENGEPGIPAVEISGETNTATLIMFLMREVTQMKEERKADAEATEAQRKADAAAAEAQRKADAKTAQTQLEKVRTELKAEIQKLQREAKDQELEIQKLQREAKDRELEWRAKERETQRYIDSLTAHIDATIEFFALGDEACLDRIKRRNLLDRAQAVVAVALGLAPEESRKASMLFREALDTNDSTTPSQDRQEKLQAMLERKKSELPRHVASLLSDPAALQMLADRFPRVRKHGDEVAHNLRERSWYEAAVLRAVPEDRLGLTPLLDTVVKT